MQFTIQQSLTITGDAELTCPAIRTWQTLSHEKGADTDHQIPVPLRQVSVRSVYVEFNHGFLVVIEVHPVCLSKTWKQTIPWCQRLSVEDLANCVTNIIYRDSQYCQISSDSVIQGIARHKVPTTLSDKVVIHLFSPPLSCGVIRSSKCQELNLNILMTKKT